MDVYEIVTEKIINLLEQGIVPWRRPWSATGLPRNLVSQKAVSRREFFSAFGHQIRLAVLAQP